MTRTTLHWLLTGTILVVGFVWLPGCAVPLAPGYKIEKQSITVRYVPGAPPHLAIRAEYRLANIGNQPLDSIEIGLPGARGFGRENLRAQVGGRDVTLRMVERGRGPDEGESALSGTWPTVWRILLAPAWPRKRKRNLVIAYDLAPPAEADPRILVGQQAFYLNDSGWFPNPLTPKAPLAKDVVRPDPSGLSVDVPPDFLATASGEPKGAHQHNGEVEYRFRLRKDDFDPFVIAGKYQQQTITTSEGAVLLWTLQPVPAARAEQSGSQITAAAKFYETTFGSLPRSMKKLYDIELPQETNRSYNSLDSARLAFLPGVVYDWVLSPGKSSSGALVNGLVTTLGQVALAYTWFGHTIRPRPEAWILSLALTDYAVNLEERGKDTRTSRVEQIQSDLKDYDNDRKGAVEKPIMALTPADPKEQLQIGEDKAGLFLFAIEDKCGRENVEHALAHMVYALRGGTYGYEDFRAALEQECHQDLGEFFRAWLTEKGIPADFRARYSGQGKPEK